MAKTIDITVPDLDGRVAVVTGASDGIGLRIAARLAWAGAEVIMPVRNPDKGAAAAHEITGLVPHARLEVRTLDLSSLASVAEFADSLLRDGRQLDVLVNNAGLMEPPARQLSIDGHELQFATNHLGHFALTLQLLPLLSAAKGRVVSQVSVAADRNAVNWDDLDWAQGYHPMRAYSSSKIALGLFGVELQRRSDAEGWAIDSMLSHPGVTPTNLLAAQPQFGRSKDTVAVRLIRTMSRLGVLVGTPESAALPAVLAATSPDAEGGQFFGPSGFQHLGGPPAEQTLYSRLSDPEDGRRIWERSELMSGVTASV